MVWILVIVGSYRHDSRLRGSAVLADETTFSRKSLKIAELRPKLPCAGGFFEPRNVCIFFGPFFPGAFAFRLSSH